MSILDITPNQLKRAAAIKEQIERLSRELRGILGAAVNARAKPTTNRTMSAAAKRKIAAAQKARWANLRRAKPAKSPARSPKANSNAKSPATRAKLSAKMKAYWAAKRAGKEAGGKSKSS